MSWSGSSATEVFRFEPPPLVGATAASPSAAAASPPGVSAAAGVPAEAECTPLALAGVLFFFFFFGDLDGATGKENRKTREGQEGKGRARGR